MATKSRFHRALTHAFRTRLRSAGMAVDEERAQYMLAGMPVVADPWRAIADQLRHDVFEDRHEISRAWESEHEGVRPFPKPFAERVLDAAKAIGDFLSQEDADALGAVLLTDDLRTMCRAEMRLDDEWMPDE